MPSQSQRTRTPQPRGRRPKHVPQRMCVSCRERSAKRSLIRIVRGSDGAVEIDPTGKRNGRGAYLCERPQCWDRALRTGALGRALNAAVGAEVATALKNYAMTLPVPADGAGPQATEESGS